ncbi:MAG: hypothetical protein ACLFR0_05675 [Alphaproteobacteria bacterium]
MVDSIKGIGQVSGTQSNAANKSQNSGREEKSGGVSLDGEVEVNISSEALSLANAEKAASNTRAQLENNPNATLSRGEGLEELLG